MNNWKETTLGEVSIYINRGVAPSYSDDGILVINQRCIRGGKVCLDEAKITDNKKKKISKDKMLQDFDIVICSTGVGTLGRVAQLGKIDFTATADSHVTIVRPSLEVDPIFIGYLLKKSEKEIEHLAEGSTGQTELPRQKLTDFNVLLPLPGEQKSIADILISLDDKIELLEGQNKTLEKIAQTIFKEWFVNFNFPFDFAQGRPNENGQPYAASGGKMTTSDLGLIPEGWKVGKLSEIALLKSGFAFDGGDFVEKSSAKVLKIKDLKGGGEIDLGDISFIKDDVVEQERVRYFKLDSGDVLVAMSGNTTGKIGVVPGFVENLFLNQRVGKFFMKDKDFRNFLYIFLMAGDYESVISSLGYGSAQPNINPAQIGNIDMILPRKDVFLKFKNTTDPIMEKVLINKSQIQILSKFRDTLLPKLMSGEIRVK